MLLIRNNQTRKLGFSDAVLSAAPSLPICLMSLMCDHFLLLLFVQWSSGLLVVVAVAVVAVACHVVVVNAVCTKQTHHFYTLCSPCTYLILPTSHKSSACQLGKSITHR